MLKVYNVLLVALFCVYTSAFYTHDRRHNRTFVPSRTIYDLVQARRVASILAAKFNRTRYNTTTDKLKTADIQLFAANDDTSNKFRDELDDTSTIVTQLPGPHPNRVLILVAAMLLSAVIIVTACLVTRYYHFKWNHSISHAECQKPLNRAKYKQNFHQFSNSKKIKIKSSHLPRTPSTAV